MRACVPTLACVSVSLWVYDFILCVPLCVFVISVTHIPFYERHITLQMTLLDGDGPFNYSTLMQSAVNTLNQAAEEEAAYPSSLPLSPSFSPSLALTLSLSLSFLSLLVPLSFALYPFHCICPILVLLLSTFWFPSPFATSISKYCMQTLPSL